MNLQPDMIGNGWLEVLDGNPTARDLFTRHYSNPRRDGGRGKQPALIIGPGYKMLLITADAGAVCAWRKADIRLDDQTGVECSIFRREQGDIATSLLLAAMRLAWLRWPGQRLFTFVDPREVKPTWRAGRPTWGHCFYQAGWRFAGLTKKRLHILEKVTA
ncbi:hypothetical protein [Mesorhizobium sp. B2-1-3A]|uniref:hypothetical protein n=1 Tax=Mesorhizobium sp. B2-1-3A TaxID=2589971 RepID=UPI00112A93C4|nr:hypothetical protein [Mesorhizobium sp. B2-1-3A]TPM92713.1 hypothetical protein FJ977_27915 [Mesorhizobium sp. B2-1-3A]